MCLTGDVFKAFECLSSLQSSGGNLKAVRGEEVNARRKGRGLCQIVRINYFLKAEIKLGRHLRGNCVNTQALHHYSLFLFHH